MDITTDTLFDLLQDLTQWLEDQKHITYEHAAECVADPIAYAEHRARWFAYDNTRRYVSDALERLACYNETGDNALCHGEG